MVSRMGQLREHGGGVLMADWIKWENIKDVLTNPLLLMTAAFACFAALYLPASFYEGTDAPAFLAQNRSWIRLGLVVILSAIAARLAFSVLKAVRSFLARRKRAHVRTQREAQRQAEGEQQRQTALRHLDALNTDERRLLRHCVNVRARTMAIRPSETVGNSLVDKGIMTMADGDAFGCPYTIQEFVWNVIKDAPPELAEDDPIRRERDPRTALSQWTKHLRGNPYF